MYDVALYGHLTLDRIFDGFQKDLSIGSIGNVWKHLNKNNPFLKIYIEPTDIGEALIMINRKNNERSSIANLSLQVKYPILKTAKWNHIMYINQLENHSFIKRISEGIISADICRGEKIKDLSILENIDFLFLSDEDEFMNPLELCKLLKKGLILHHTTGSSYYDNTGNVEEIKVKLIDNVNVLGCGDMLVAGFIGKCLKNGNILQSLKESHKTITNILQKQKRRMNGKS